MTLPVERIATRGAFMDSTRSLARRAGLLYVLASSTAPFSYLRNTAIAAVLDS